MRIRCAAALSASALAVAVWATGFPKRIGLTASEAAVSLPGDLIIAAADVVVDRGIRIDADARTVWSVLVGAFEDDEASRVIAREEEEALILAVPTPGLEDEDDLPGTCVFALLPLTNGRTLLHLRERHQSCEPDAPKAALWTGLALESVTAMMLLHDIKKAAELAS